jgi:transcriptional regulator with XRE-family HTH domain
MPHLNTIATLLKRLRVQSSLTQMQLGERIGVTKASISAYEKGKAYPSTPILTKLAHEFSLSIDELRVGDAPGRARLPGPTPAPPVLAEVPYLPSAARPTFAAALATSQQRAREPLALVALPAGCPLVDPATALVVEIDDTALEPILRPGARVLAVAVAAAEWPFMPPGIYCLAYRGGLVIKRLRDNTLLQTGLLLLHADGPAGGSYPVRAEDLCAVWHVRWAVYLPLT